MSDEMKPISLLYMWMLVTRGGEALLKDIRPECKPEYRRPLVAMGLLAELPAGNKKKLVLTDAGWHYLSTHMTNSVKTMSAAASSDVLQGVLAAMHRHMREAGVGLAEMFSPEAKTGSAAETPAGRDSALDSGDDLWSRLVRSWSRLQEADDGIRLEKLRPAFADVARERLDEALLEWQKQGKIVIYPHDDGERVTPEVKDAALKAGGRDLHVIYQK